MIKVDEDDPVGELDPSFPYRDVVIKRNTDMKDYYKLQEEIGRGKFGTVYLCTEKKTGLNLAAKFVGIARRQDRKNVEAEVEIMKELQHPRLIQIYDAFESANVMCVILELIEGGELFERVIDDDFILTERACTVFMRQICEGVEFIHSKNVVHLDMKPENILCLTKTGNRIKIIDFGLARKHDPDKKQQVLFGTPEFVAPEVVNFDRISLATDMWSVGVICYVLLSGLSPFMGETDIETMTNVTLAQYDFDDEAFDDISDNAKDFIAKLLVKDKENRLTASECLSHPWLWRKTPPPPPSLITSKENLKNFVDRYITAPIENNVTLEKQGARAIQSLIQPVAQDFTNGMINDDLTTPFNNVQNNVRSHSLEHDQHSVGKETPILTNIKRLSPIGAESDANTAPPILITQPQLHTAIVAPENASRNLPVIIHPEKDTSAPAVNEKSILAEGENSNAPREEVLPAIPLGAIPRSSVQKPEPEPEPEKPLEKQPEPKVVTQVLEEQEKNKPEPKLAETKFEVSKEETLLPKKMAEPICEVPREEKKIGTEPEIPGIGISPIPPTKETVPRFELPKVETVPEPKSTKIINVFPQKVFEIRNGVLGDNKKRGQEPEVPEIKFGLPIEQKSEPPIKETGLRFELPKVETVPEPKSAKIINVFPQKVAEIRNGVLGDNKNREQEPVLETIFGLPIEQKIKPPIKETGLRFELPKEEKKMQELKFGGMRFEVPKGERMNLETAVKTVNPPEPIRNIGETQRECNTNNTETTVYANQAASVHRESFKREKRFVNTYTPRHNEMAEFRPGWKLNPNPCPKIHGIVLGQSSQETDTPSFRFKPRDTPSPGATDTRIHNPSLGATALPIDIPSPTAKSSAPDSPRYNPSPRTTGSAIAADSRQHEFSEHYAKESEFTTARGERVRETFVSSHKFLKSTAPWFSETSCVDGHSGYDKSDRRASDISCFLHDDGESENVNLAEEIRKLSARLYQLSHRRYSTEDEIRGTERRENNPSGSSERRDPVAQYMATHGVTPSRRPKFKLSNLNRDVPYGSVPPPSNVVYYLYNNVSETVDQEGNSSSGTVSKVSRSESEKIKVTAFGNKDQKSLAEKSSIDSLANYFRSTKTDTKHSSFSSTK